MNLSMIRGLLSSFLGLAGKVVTGPSITCLLGSGSDRRLLAQVLRDAKLATKTALAHAERKRSGNNQKSAGLILLIMLRRLLSPNDIRIWTSPSWPCFQRGHSISMELLPPDRVHQSQARMA